MEDDDSTAGIVNMAANEMMGWNIAMEPKTKIIDDEMKKLGISPAERMGFGITREWVNYTEAQVREGVRAWARSRR